MSRDILDALSPAQLSNLGFVDRVLVRSSRRAWWQARLSDGRILSEWQTLRDPGRPDSGRWEEVDKGKVVGLRLLCPDGQAGELRGRPYRFFQFKQSVAFVGAGSRTLCHIIGVVTDDELGTCECFSWQTPGRLVGPFTDNVLNFKYGGVGPLGLANLGLRLGGA